MHRTLSLAELVEESDAFEQAVLATPAISTVCSAMDWQMAAQHALHSNRTVQAYERDGHWVLFATGAFPPFAQAFQPLEFAWGFGSCILGPDPQAAVDLLLDLLQEYRDRWQLTLLSGIPTHSALLHQLYNRLSQRYTVDIFDGAHCMIGDLSEGPQAYLSRRSSRFRTNLRRQQRKINEAGISFDWIDSPTNGQQLFQRALAVEQETWKYKEQSSIFLLERYHNFYAHLLRRMAAKGNARALFARVGDQDIAYIFGGILNSVYRGFQLGYNEEFSSLGLGNVVQWEMIQRLAKEGITDYDLGMEMDYKRRWSDRTLKLSNFAVFAAP